MSIPYEFKDISSLNPTAEEIVRSKDFMRGLRVILKQVKKFDKEYIEGLFIKLQSGTNLVDEEKEDLFAFISDEKVSRLGQKLLNKLKKASINLESDTNSGSTNFGELLNSILAEDGYDRVQSCIGEVLNLAELTLEKYKGFSMIKIKDKGVEKEIWLENNNLRIDSSDWPEIYIDIFDLRIKINKERDIIEYLDGIFAGEQGFTWDAAMREAKKQGKRLFKDESEFEAIIDSAGLEPFTNSRFYEQTLDDELGLQIRPLIHLWVNSSLSKDDKLKDAVYFTIRDEDHMITSSRTVSEGSHVVIEDGCFSKESIHFARCVKD